MNVPNIIQLYFRSSILIEKKNKEPKIQRLEDQPLSEQGRRKQSGRVTPHLALRAWSSNTMTAEKRQWKKKKNPLEMGILKDTTNLSFSRAIISIFFSD